MAFQIRKRKANTDDKCYNYHKFGHFGQNCSLPDKKLNRIQNFYNSGSRSSSQSGSQAQNNNSRVQSQVPSRNNSQINRANQTMENYDKSDHEFFKPGPIGATFIVKERQLQKVNSSSWYLDSCASRHLCNDCRLFNNTHAKSIDFIIAVGQVIWSEEVGTVFIVLSDSTTVELHNLALTSNCDLNLISLG